MNKQDPPRVYRWDDGCWETRPEMEQRQDDDPAVREVNKDFEITNEIKQ